MLATAPAPEQPVEAVDDARRLDEILLGETDLVAAEFDAIVAAEWPVPVVTATLPPGAPAAPAAGLGVTGMRGRRPDPPRADERSPPGLPTLTG